MASPSLNLDAHLKSECGHNMSTATVDELLEEAKWAFDYKAPAFLLAAVNKVLAEVAPDEEPRSAEKRLAAAWHRWGIEAGYDSLLFYYQDSLDPGRFRFWEDDEEWDWRSHYLEVAHDMIKILRAGNG